MKVCEGTKIASPQCASCPFLKNGIKLPPERMLEIHKYLAEGTNHFCHSDVSNHTICRGGRNHQLNLWHRMGVIDEPTDEALRVAMQKMGIEPREHV